MATPGEPSDGRLWLLLIHQIPPKPDYLRVKIGRRLARVGAAPIKNSVYVLPAAAQTMEDFQWILREIVEGGGEGSICRAAFVDGLTDEGIERLLTDARTADYDAIASESRAIIKQLPSARKLVPADREAAAEALARLRKRMALIDRMDFFGAPTRSAANEAVDALAARLRPMSDSLASAKRPFGDAAPRGRTWVTREGIYVDRIASAWLIRRFIDPEARFKFVTPHTYRPRPTEIRFDMSDAHYTHEGGDCTFETLLRRFSLDDPALAEIAEIVHDIDLKDDKFARDDAAGIDRVLAGIAATYPEDEGRLARGSQLFDELYLLLQRGREGNRRVLRSPPVTG